MDDKMINWTEVYLDMFKVPVPVFPDPAPDPGNVKPCRIIPCPGSYFSSHDDMCEMVFDEEDFVYADCQCESRARERSWPTTT